MSIGATGENCADDDDDRTLSDPNKLRLLWSRSPGRGTRAYIMSMAQKFDIYGRIHHSFIILLLGDGLLASPTGRKRIVARKSLEIHHLLVQTTSINFRTLHA